MRLDEWQRWLDTQYLDPRAGAEESPEPEEDLVRESGAPQPHAVASVDSISAVQSPPVEIPAEERPTQGTPSPLQARTGMDATVSPVEEIEVPSIESYLPFLRNRETTAAPADEEASLTPPEMPADHDSADPAPPTPEHTKEKAVEATSESIDTRPGPAQVEPPEVIENGSVVVAESAASSETTPLPAPETTTGSAPSDHVTQTLEEPPILRAQRAITNRRYGISHRRARHARNIRPDEVVDELNDGALWKLVPKHIQVLISLGSDEVAQNSYKRSFRESRLELINRLLDPTLSLEDTARLLNVCPTTVRRYTNKGLLTHQRTQGDQRRFKLSDVLAFLEAQSRAGGRR